jgi:hypothetical protein
VHGFGTIVVGLVFVALGWFLRNEDNQLCLVRTR